MTRKTAWVWVIIAVMVAVAATPLRRLFTFALAFVVLNVGACSMNRSADFHGKVVDQDGKPMQGVEVAVSVQVIRGYYSSHRESAKFMTGTSGQFHVCGLRGRTLTFDRIKKRGYEVTGGTLRDLNLHEPHLTGPTGTPENPVVAVMSPTTDSAGNKIVYNFRAPK